MKKIVCVLMCVSLTCSMLIGCGSAGASAVEQTAPPSQEEVTKDSVKSAEDKVVSGEAKSLERPSLIAQSDDSLYDPSLVPCVEAYEVADDFSNIINPEELDYVSNEFKDLLKKNLFVVGDENGREFFETYEFNSYSQTPNFVTVDSLMHTYHIYFAHLLKTTEKSYLFDAIKTISKNMFDESVKMCEEYMGTSFEDAAKRNVAYFGIACNLIGEQVDVPDYADALVSDEVGKIMAAKGISMSELVGLEEDYSQYKPRGYYDEDEQLKKYFRTMMWYGRMSFATREEDMTKSAMLMSMALDASAVSEWEAVYAITSFFAGASDDLGYCEYLPLVRECFGENPSAEDIAGNEDAWAKFYNAVKEMPSPQIQSIPVWEFEEENVIQGFRFMGQRFTIDSAIMQNLIYRSIRENQDDERRNLPDVLDVPAALGSDVAKALSLEAGADRFPDYSDKLDEVRESFNNSNDTLWYASLYSQWLNTLRPLLTEKGEGYPSFMQTYDWTKKTIETFAGSYTELKHDTVLYAKQPMAEMGGGYDEDIDDRGYVEPEPLVYARFASLSEATCEGLKKYEMIGKDDVENLGLLKELAESLLVISQKELKNELPTDEEFELIRNYGGNIEHFWYEVMKADSGKEYVSSEEFPAALVVDVATDPNGLVLEAGCGNPREVSVIVPVEGKLRIATGSVYNFYQFEWPLSDRLTDSTWRTMCGAMPGEGFEYHRDENLDNPEWTKSYRAVQWHYEDWE